ncbi:MAG: hypothetical protein UX89_C0006G0023 [Parcubacteria group bacterium GW2011_GWA2_47_16]|nr:MAG: hypothetical protein UX89_C0006G0023 [Parcubacteria group bacterium GW2011_GWA2_47_16]
MKNTVLIVDKPGGWDDSASVGALRSKGVTVHIADSVVQAGSFFNGKATAKVLVVGDVSGASDLIRSIKDRFADAVWVVGLAEHIGPLANLGCNCFIPRDRVHTTAQAYLER